MQLHCKSASQAAATNMDTWANDMARDMDHQGAAAAAPALSDSERLTQIDGFLQEHPIAVSSVFSLTSSEDSGEYYEEFTDSLQGEIEVELSESPVGSQDDNNVIHQLGSQETTDQANGHLRISREQKNERERTRIRKKGDLLAELQQIVKRSHLIRSDTKRKRFTEMYTLKLVQELILAQRSQLTTVHRNSSRVPLPFSIEPILECSIPQRRCLPPSERQLHKWSGSNQFGQERLEYQGCQGGSQRPQ